MEVFRIHNMACCTFFSGKVTVENMFPFPLFSYIKLLGGGYQESVLSTQTHFLSHRSLVFGFFFNSPHELPSPHNEDLEPELPLPSLLPAHPAFFLFFSFFQNRSPFSGLRIRCQTRVFREKREIQNSCPGQMGRASGWEGNCKRSIHYTCISIQDFQFIFQTSIELTQNYLISLHKD